MKRYDSYKDSRIEWIGEIPIHWTITKVKYETNLVNDGSHFTPTYTENGIPFLRVTDIHNKKIDLDKVKFISEEEHRQLIKRCNPKRGDLLLSKNGTIGLTKVIDWDWDFSIFVSLCLIKFKKVFEPELFSYFFQSSIVDLQIKESSKQSTVTNLHLDKIRELLLIKPPLNEQQQIVSFLDIKTSLIDSLIEKTQRKIELLKEKRTSLINEVVTKGLNPNGDMKDSGVEWIGKIPSGWGCFEFKFVVNLLTDFESNGSFKSVKENVKVLDDLGPVWYVRMTDLENNNIRNDKCKYCDFDTYEFLHKTKLDGGELLITKRGEIGKVYIFPKDSGISTLGPNSYLLKLDESKVSPNFLFYFYKSDFGQITLKLMDKSTTIGSIYKDDLKNSKVIIPPLSEQQQIVEYLDEQTQLIDKTISIEKKRIQLLKEYRQSLISEVVTGKRKVV